MLIFGVFLTHKYKNMKLTFWKRLILDIVIYTLIFAIIQTFYKDSNGILTWKFGAVIGIICAIMNYLQERIFKSKER